MVAKCLFAWRKMTSANSAVHVLDVDAGNTFIKWRLRGAVKVERQLTAQLSSEGWQCDIPHVSRVCIASVAGEAVNKLLTVKAKQLWAVHPEFAYVKADVAGVIPCYEDLSRLGVDRWLAMLAAYSALRRGCAVMSAGSALTADWLDADGRHMGGLIAPGRARMAASLHRDLAQVLHSSELPFAKFNQVLGRTTESCCNAGIQAMMAGFMMQVVNYDKDNPIWLAGGDSDAMLSLCANEHKHRVKRVNNIVLEGLAIALP